MALKKPEKIYEDDENISLKNRKNELRDTQGFNSDTESINEDLDSTDNGRWTKEDENNLEEIKHKISEVTKKIREKSKELLLRSHLEEKIKTTEIEKSEVDAEKFLLEEIKGNLLGLIDGKKITEVKTINIEKKTSETNLFIKAEVIVNTKLPNKSFNINIELSNKDIRTGIKGGDGDKIEQQVDVENYSVKGGNIITDGRFGPKQSIEFALAQKFKNFYTDIKKYIEKKTEKKVDNIKIENGDLKISFYREAEEDTSNIEIEKLDTLLQEKEDLESTLEKLNNDLSELRKRKIDSEENINRDIEISNKKEKILTKKNVINIKHEVFNLSPERKNNILKAEDKVFKDPNVWEKLKKLINLPNNELIILIENWEEWTEMPEDTNLSLAGTRLLTTLAEALDIKLSEEETKTTN